MSSQISVESFRTLLLDLFTETFEQVQGIYLDRGTSLFETLATISAGEASRPVSATCASLAAQVEHTRFYVDVMEDYLKGQPPENVDWGDIWRTVEAVTPDEWDASKQRLQASYQRVRALVQTIDTWEGDSPLYDGLAIVVHTAYHLGEIRQALCTLRLP